MPRTQDEKNETSNRIKEIQKKIEESSRERTKIETLKYESDLRGLRQGARKEKQSLVASQKWKELDELLKSMKVDWNRGYSNDWTSSYYSMLALTIALAEAVAAAQPIGKILHQLNLLLGEAIEGKDNTKLTSLIEQTVEAYRYTYPPETVFPRLAPFAQLKEGQLDVESLDEIKSADGSSLMAHINLAQKEVLKDNFKVLKDNLKLAVIDWLDDEGYNFVSESGSFVHKTSNADLTTQVFDAMRDDPNSGLSAHLVRMFNNQNGFNPAPGLLP